MYARSGRVFERAKKIDAWLEKHMQDGWVLDGELMAKEWNDTASIIGSRKNHKDDDSLQFHVFDCMTLEAWKTHDCAKPYADRLADIPVVLGAVSETVVPAQGKTVSNEVELLAYFDECVAKGYEGIMVKRLDTPYVFKRSDAVMKLKPIVSWDCVLTDVLPAKDGTKWEGMHTIIAVQVPGGGITRVGTGFSDEEREFLNAERGKLVGRPCEVQGQPPLTEDGKIRFPRFMRWREEWDVSPEVKELVSKVKG
jgi:ATP-dependent DNA ligase